MSTFFPEFFPSEGVHILHILESAGWESRFVGGAVRDYLYGVDDAKDFDIATTALPEVIQHVFHTKGYKVLPTGIQFGSVKVGKSGKFFDITTLREDVETDGRHAKVAYTKSFYVDALRRDFTINAMSMDVRGQVYDYFQGRQDLSKGYIRFVGDPVQRIKEDYLRILRYFRFLGRYGKYGGDIYTLWALSNQKTGLLNLSSERISSELKRIIMTPKVVWVMGMMDRLGIISLLLPNACIEEFSNHRVSTIINNPLLRLFSLYFNREFTQQDWQSLHLSKKEKRLWKMYAQILAHWHWPASALCAFYPLYILRDITQIKDDPEKKAYFQRVHRIPNFPLTGEDIRTLPIPENQRSIFLNKAKYYWGIHEFTPNKIALKAYLYTLATRNTIMSPS